ncbi:MAG: hypothetical protein GVY25_02755 [Bacteroidetes bacterium]|nr:hypothetical protein [Bacteroidota bacterium]
MPCDQIPAWQHVVGEEVPQSVLNRLNTEPALQEQGVFDDAAFFQRLEDTAGTSINQDYLSVVVDQSSPPGAIRIKQYLEQIHTSLNDYIDTSISECEGYSDESWGRSRWNSSNPLGSVPSIDLVPAGLEYGSVVSIVNTSDRRIFATGRPWMNLHAPSFRNGLSDSASPP